MLYVLTEGERRFIMETLTECKEYSGDLSDGCLEALEILKSLERTKVEDYEQ